MQATKTATTQPVQSRRLILEAVSAPMKAPPASLQISVDGRGEKHDALRMVRVTPLVEQYELNHRLYYPVYATCAELGLPIFLTAGVPGAENIFDTVFVLVVVFTLVHLTPGDPAAIILGDQATPEDVEALREQLGLNDPLPIQFVNWFTGVLTLDFGDSIFLGIPVTEALRDRVAGYERETACTSSEIR